MLEKFTVNARSPESPEQRFLICTKTWSRVRQPLGAKLHGSLHLTPFLPVSLSPGKRKLTDESFSTHSCNSTSVTRAIGNQPAVCGAMIENGMKLRPEHRCVQSELGCARRHLVIEAYCAAYCLGERNLCRATNQWPEVPEPCFRGFERNRCPWDGDAESKRNKFQ